MPPIQPRRIDLFIDDAMKVTLGEFSPFPFSGKLHCFAPGGDWCYMGRMWKERGAEGGDVESPPPYLQNWNGLSRLEQCEAVMALDD